MIGMTVLAAAQPSGVAGVSMKVGLLALAIGIALDWQGLFPAIGDRLAALMALVVGAGLLGASPRLDGWITKGANALGAWAGTTTKQVDPRIGALVASLLVGLLVAVLFTLWLLAMIPGTALSKKVVGAAAGNRLDSRLIWSGVLFPPLIDLIPAGALHSLAHWSIGLGIGAGAWFVGLVF